MGISPFASIRKSITLDSCHILLQPLQCLHMKRYISILFSVLFLNFNACGSSTSSNTSSGSELGPPFDQLSGLATCDSSNSSFAVSPLDSDAFELILPLGLTEGPNHTFPTGHTYMGLTDKAVERPIYAPTDITIYRVRRTVDTDANTSAITIYFAPCANLSAHFGHATSFAEDINAQITFTEDECSTDGSTTDCSKEGLEISANAGDIIAYVGGELGDDAGALDFGLLDSRVTSYELIGSSSQEAAQYNAHAVCPYDYFSDSTLQTLFTSRLNSGVVNAGDPLCGTLDTDIENTAQGRWYNQDESSTSEQNHVFLGIHFRDSQKSIFSIGSSNDLDGAVYVFTHVTSGQVNRQFSDISFDGNIYCFDHLASRYFNSNDVSGYVMVQMPSNTSITIEYVDSGSCPSDPNTLSFSSNAATFIR